MSAPNVRQLHGAALTDDAGTSSVAAGVHIRDDLWLITRGIGAPAEVELVTITATGVSSHGVTPVDDGIALNSFTLTPAHNTNTGLNAAAVVVMVGYVNVLGINKNFVRALRVNGDLSVTMGARLLLDPGNIQAGFFYVEALGCMYTFGPSGGPFRDFDLAPLIIAPNLDVSIGTAKPFIIPVLHTRPSPYSLLLTFTARAAYDGTCLWVAEFSGFFRPYPSQMAGVIDFAAGTIDGSLTSPPYVAEFLPDTTQLQDGEVGSLSRATIGDHVLSDHTLTDGGPHGSLATKGVSYGPPIAPPDHVLTVSFRTHPPDDLFAVLGPAGDGAWLLQCAGTLAGETRICLLLLDGSNRVLDSITAAAADTSFTVARDDDGTPYLAMVTGTGADLSVTVVTIRDGRFQPVAALLDAYPTLAPEVKYQGPNGIHSGYVGWTFDGFGDSVFEWWGSTDQAYLRMSQREDGLGISGHPRLLAGQRSGPRIGTDKRII